MLRVSLVTINSQYSHMNPAMYSFYYYLKEHLDASIWQDLDIEHIILNVNQNRDDIQEELHFANADIYCFSVYIWNSQVVDDILEYLKSTRPNALLLGGGPEIQYDHAREYERQSAWDCIFLSDGEVDFYDFFTSLESIDLASAKIYLHHKKEKDRGDHFPERKRLHPKDLAFYYPMIEERLEHKIVHYESSRACPFQCSYCISCLEKPALAKDVEQVKTELLYFIEKEYAIIKFLDRSFNFPQERALSILSFLIEESEKRGIEKMPRFHFEMEANLFDESMCTLLEQAPKDLFQLEIGIQSIHEETLKKVRRNPLRKEQEMFLTRIIQADKQKVHLDLIAGLPGENLAMLKSSYQKLWDYHCDMLQVGHLKLLRGTPIVEEAINRGYTWNSQAPYEVYTTDTMSQEDFIKIKKVAWMTEKYMDAHVLAKTLRFYVKEYQCDPFDLLLELNEEFSQWRGAEKKFLSKEEVYLVFLSYLNKKRANALEKIFPIFFEEFQASRKKGALSLEKVLQRHRSNSRIGQELIEKIKEISDDSIS